MISSPPKLPVEFLCEEHKELPPAIAEHALYRQIEDLRRQDCHCLIDGLYQWYDLVGQFRENEEN